MRRAMVLALVLGFGLHAMADFADEFQKAKKLYSQKKYEAAAEAFRGLAASAPNAHGKAWSLSYAARALGLQKRYDESIELAKSIESKPMAAYTQMEVMNANRKHKKLIEAFKQEDIDSWPDAINYKGFLLRGMAYAAVKNAQLGVKDLERCVDLSGSDTWTRLEALNKAAPLHAELKDDAKAMQAYNRAFAIYDAQPNRKGRWTFPQALLGAARLLMSQDRHVEARKVLDKFNDWPHGKRRGPWDFLVLEAQGDIALAENRSDEALKKYREAITIDTHKSYVGRVKKKIGQLQKRAAGDPQP